MPMSEYDKTRAAAAQVDASTGFYIHFAIYVLVIAMLLAINYREGEEWWAQWPALGWGIGILGHALAAFGHSSKTISQWRLRRISRARANIR